MGLYTIYEEKRVDTAFDYFLQSILSVILKNVDSLRSLMVLGGYGRGEGSIIFNGSNNFKLVNDLDLVAITGKIPSKLTAIKIVDEIKKQFQDSICNGIEIPPNFEIDIRYLKPNQLDFPDIWFYDLKTSGRVVYGQDLREKVSYTARDIPLSSGFRILFQKVTALLKSFSYNYLMGAEITNYDYEFMVYASLKTFVEIGTSLCILAKKYKPSYLERVKVLHELDYEEFGELIRKIPELPMLVEIATKFKLRPAYGSMPDLLKSIGCNDAIDLWFKAKDVLERYILFYVSRFANKQLTMLDLPKACEILSKIYYTPMLLSLVRKNSVLSSDTFVKMLNFNYQFMLNILYIKKLFRETGRIYLTPILKPFSPSLKFYGAGALILFSLQRDGSIKKEYIERALNLLNYCVPIHHMDKFDADSVIWDNAKVLYFNAFSLYEWMR